MIWHIWHQGIAKTTDINILIKFFYPLGIGILRFADAHNCKELSECALSHINSHFPEVANHEEILEVSQQELSRLISSELIRVDSEFQVFTVAMKWIKHEVSIRKRFVFDILANVRLSLIPIRLIEQEIAECQDVSLKIALRSIVVSTFFQIFGVLQKIDVILSDFFFSKFSYSLFQKDLLSRRGTLCPVVCNPRLGAKKSIYIIGGKEGEYC